MRFASPPRKANDSRFLLLVRRFIVVVSSAPCLAVSLKLRCALSSSCLSPSTRTAMRPASATRYASESRRRFCSNRFMPCTSSASNRALAVASSRSSRAACRFTALALTSKARSLSFKAASASRASRSSVFCSAFCAIINWRAASASARCAALTRLARLISVAARARCAASFSLADCCSASSCCCLLVACSFSFVSFAFARSSRAAATLAWRSASSFAAGPMAVA
mmetsp:Transcript_71778/g.144481  ORF Transcript_71778/g.144481 Transcript_71778/m.144481 type:complete len:225 (+) Transcript_71778:805-1479(+)